MKTIHIDISDNIKGMECGSCESKFIVSKEEFGKKGAVNCPHCEKKCFSKENWDNIKSDDTN